MTQEEKQLLMKDLFARLPYGVTVRVEGDWFYDKKEPYDCKLTPHIFTEQLIVHNGNIMPYLRPMSSMTYEERQDARDRFFNGSDHYDIDDIGEIYADTYQPYTTVYTLSFARLSGYIDWLNAHHFDHRGLIPMGLALEAPEGMYKTE